MLAVLATLETTCGALSAIGALFILMKHEMELSFYGAVLASLILLMLFFGQRVSKDYKGAAVLVPYFIVAIIGIYVMQ
jgi:hypothetical protein